VAVTIEDYRPSPELDADLAALGYDAVRGWPDQRPVSGPVMHGYLRPTSMTATTLAVHRDDKGHLLACAALRWPATIDAAGLLWGPMVHPSARGRGLGRLLLAEINAILAAHPGVRVVTAGIPESRAAGWALFEELGWRTRSTSSLMARALPAGAAGPTSVAIRPARQGEYLDPVLASLYTASWPDASPTVARDTFARWSSDVRYKPDGLLLAENGDGVCGAVMVYPCQHPTADASEPPEARMVDLLTCSRLAPVAAERVRDDLVAAALRRADDSGAAVARMVAESSDLARALSRAGFEAVDQFRHYGNPRPPGSRPLAMPEPLRVDARPDPR
jgi:GNAT superfamily N-acetyltransferase